MSERLKFRFGFCLLLQIPLQAIAGAVDIESVSRNAPQAWEDFTRTADFDIAYSAYGVLDKVRYTVAGVDAEACRENAAYVDDAVSKAPVSIAVVRVALLCAEATDQLGKAEKLEIALVALLKEALKGGRQLPWSKPIRVLGPNDAYTLVHAAGLETRYEYFELIRPARYFPLVVAAWDPESKKEVRYVFDYVDSTSMLKGTNEYHGYPFYKNLLVDFFVEAQAKSNQLGAVDLQAVLAARRLDDAAAKIKALRMSAEYGGIQSLRTWIAVCAVRPFKGCGDGLEDILLGLSEQKQVIPMVMLAFLHAEGVVAKRDEAVADALLAAAMGVSTEEDVALEYLTLSVITERPKAMGRKPLTIAMSRPAILAVLAAEKVRARKMLSEPEQQALAASLSNTMGVGQSWLSEYWRQQGKEDRRLQAMRLAAEAGDASAQELQAYYLMTEGPQTPAEEVLSLLRSAALGGEISAMKYLSSRDDLRHEWKSSERWLMAAIQAGDNEAMISLASLYEADREALGQTAEKAFEWYVEMSAEPAMAEARRHAAKMAMNGSGTAKDPARAEKWLLQDAQSGDAESQLLLAISYLNGDLGAGGSSKAKLWLDKILASEDGDAKSGYADWLYRNAQSTEDRTLAIGLWTALQDDKASWALNNMAWAYCTSLNPAARNPAMGLRHSEQMLKEPDLEWGKLDTVAACQAASGDYAGAVLNQQKVIAQFLRYWNMDALEESKDENGYLNRLKLYQQGKPYVEEVPPPD